MAALNNQPPQHATMPLRNGTVVGQVVLQKEYWPRFEQGVELVFNKWMALRLAVENEWGGRDSKRKADELIDDVLHWFTSKRDELEEVLDDTMQVDFNVEVEDGSALDIAKQLIELYRECLSGDFSTIDRLQHLAAPPTSACQGAQATTGGMDEGDGSGSSSSEGEEDDDGEDGDAMDVDEPATPAQPWQPVVDADGFQLVERRGRRR